MNGNLLLRRLGNFAYTLSMALLIASLLTNLMPARVAAAHHPELSGVVTCEDNGTKLITWTIANWSGATIPMKITDISVTSGSIDVAVNTEVPVGGSVTGYTSLPGSQTGQVTLSVTGLWDFATKSDVTDTKTKQVNLGGICQSPPPPVRDDYQLNLSHVYCYDGDDPSLEGLVEIHFVLLNVPDGITPGTLSYTYGTISPGAHTGNVWHYTAYLAGGTYNITSASVDVEGTTVNLHNPGAYAGEYTCGTPPVPGCTNPDALNYNPAATMDDGSCEYPPDEIPGCMDRKALNYNPDATTEDGTCAYPPVPAAVIDCYSLELSKFKVTITNNGPEGAIGYSTDLDASIISLGTMANGASETILLGAGVTTLFVYADELGTWGEAISYSIDPKSTPVCETDPMGLTPFCSYVDLNQPHGWSVTNLNAFGVSFTWSYGALSSPAPIALGAGLTYDFTTADQPGQEMRVFVDGVLLASSVPGSCPEFIPLELAGVCSEDPEGTHGWKASNWNDFPVTAEWRVNGTLLTGLLDIPASSAVFFTTPISEGDIVQLYYGGLFMDDAGAAGGCVPPENPPQTPPRTPPLVIIPLTAPVTPVLIPVTGVADEMGSLAPAGMFSLGLGFFGLGTILHGASRRRSRSG